MSYSRWDFVQKSLPGNTGFVHSVWRQVFPPVFVGVEGVLLLVIAFKWQRRGQWLFLSLTLGDFSNKNCCLERQTLCTPSRRKFWWLPEHYWQRKRPSANIRICLRSGITHSRWIVEQYRLPGWTCFEQPGVWHSSSVEIVRVRGNLEGEFWFKSKSLDLVLPCEW